MIIKKFLIRPTCEFIPPVQNLVFWFFFNFWYGINVTTTSLQLTSKSSLEESWEPWLALRARPKVSSSSTEATSFIMKRRDGDLCFLVPYTAVVTQEQKVQWGKRREKLLEVQEVQKKMRKPCQHAFRKNLRPPKSGWSWTPSWSPHMHITLDTIIILRNWWNFVVRFHLRHPRCSSSMLAFTFVTRHFCLLIFLFFFFNKGQQIVFSLRSSNRATVTEVSKHIFPSWLKGFRWISPKARDSALSHSEAICNTSCLSSPNFTVVTRHTTSREQF